MKVFWLFLLSFSGVVFSQNSNAQDTIFYSLRFSNAAHHESDISITYENVKTPYLRLALSNYSPGRYANHEFAKNVYAVKAFSAADQPLTVTKVMPNEWLVEVVDGYVKVNYTLFADHADGTYSGIDRKFIHLNAPSVFVWARGFENHPVKISFHFPPRNNWKVATQLQETGESGVYVAPNFSYLMDSPVMIGDLSEVNVLTEKDVEIFMNIHAPVVDSSSARFAGLAKKVVLEQKEIFGEFPAYDYGRYRFLCGYGEGFHGDGMEHRNSTIVTSSLELQGNEMKLIGTVAHEFFHGWNVERLRPKSLEPFNFLAPSLCGELWFAEGFTSYYAPLTLRRAGVYSDSLFLSQLTGMLNYVILSPGTGKYSPVDMSAMAAFVDASSFNDPTNFHNTFTSYYPYGAVLGLALDLELRSRFSLTLDDYMKHLWEQYGKEEIPFTNADLQKELTEFCGDAGFAEAFFVKYIYGTELPDYERIMAFAGYSVSTDEANTDMIRFNYAYADSAVVLKSKPTETSTFYVAGVNQNDRILSINGRRFNSLSDFMSFISEISPGQSLKVEFTHLGERQEATTLAKPNRSVLISDSVKDAEGKVAEKQREFRENWLSSRVKH